MPEVLTQAVNLCVLAAPITWKGVKGSKANSIDSDQTPHDVASDLGLYCLLPRFFIKRRLKSDKIDMTPLK